jgi:1,5-anhydro-D-fructose reductase (1,5-anhydro-D-mannitol-forming)
MALGWGIVGTGRAADTLVGPAINADDASHVVAIVSRNQGRAEAFAAKHGANHAYSSYDDMLADPDVQIVYIATPNALHAEQAIAAARAGKHILCDKPLAMSPAEATRVIEACRAAGVKLGVNFQTRHFAPIVETKKLIDQGVIGDVIVVQAESSARGGHAPKGWRTDPSLAGMGAVNNLAVHPLDLIRYLVSSKVSEVAAMTDVGRSRRLETLALVLLRFKNGVMAYVNSAHTIPYPQADLDIYGTRGRIVGVNSTRPFMDGELRVLTEGGEQRTPSSTHDGFTRAIVAFNQAILANETPNASGEDGLRSAELVEAIARSAHEGVVVRLDS